ncbi:MAG: glycosyltransferase [Oscillospiraceae bacterium]|nr:glycosyltransferase [Oscillospiraceae bacterium]
MEKPIHVLCVFSSLDRGGAESMCMNLYRHMDRSQVQFDFVKHTDEIGVFEDEIQSMGGRIFCAPRYTFRNRSEYCNWWKRHFREHPEHQIVHGHFFTVSAIYFRIAKKFGRRTVAHSHSVHSNRRTLKVYAADVLIHQIRYYADERFACSQPAGKWLYGSREFKVLPNAIDSTLFRFDNMVRNAVRRQFGFAEGELVVGTVGSFTSAKNPFGTIEIFKRLYRKNTAARFLWIGDGLLRKDIEAKLSEAGLAEAVILTGVREDVHRLLQAMDAFILPSLFEGLGMAAIEAQAAGLRNFLSQAVPREADITGRCRFLPLDDPEEWANAILSTDLTKEDTAARIRAAGYDIQDTSRWLQEFYLRLANHQAE